ncbi:hypothetical protein ACHHYP_06262 [Achlya hypogyna]|uniref:Uncharacterized protein n=1 Tax=Achlya hypogyna TaxID=1202772 RepID=A0A1V9YUX4_ACHHY|nr:hypothetical protein ACHHYP_06262 [Achlya hypogyna]
MDEGAKTQHWHKDVCVESRCRCGKSSVALLIDWLTADAGDGFLNYTRWKGGSKKKDGKNKIGIAGEISSILAEHGLHRTDKSVKAKIEELKTKYRKVSDKYDRTGSGIKEEAILDDVLKICSHYNEIKCVFGGRPSARPVLCSSNEDDTQVTMETLSSLAFDDDDSTCNEESDEDDVPQDEPQGDEDVSLPASPRHRTLTPSRYEGSPPRSTHSSSVITPTPKSSKRKEPSEAPDSVSKNSQAPNLASKQQTKKLKLTSERKKIIVTVSEGMLKGIKEQSAVTKDAVERKFESRSAELEYKKLKDKCELEIKKSDLEIKNAELEYKKSKDKDELGIKKSDMIAKQRSLCHAEIMQEAELMHKLGFTKEEVMDFIRSHHHDR